VAMRNLTSQVRSLEGGDGGYARLRVQANYTSLAWRSDVSGDEITLWLN
jgi:uncharacterized protein YhdP